jgi:type IV pilus assembly protein PilK
MSFIPKKEDDDRLWRYKAPPVFSEFQLQRWQSLLEQRTGISYALHTSILQAGIYRRMIEIGCNDYDDYYREVQSGVVGYREWGELLNCVTVQDTRFFRDQLSFNYLKAYLLQRIPALNKRKDTLEMWSAGCASGEEAWSLALLARQCIELSRSQLYYGVLGSDISSAALAKARGATYRETQLGNVEPEVRERWLQSLSSGDVRVVADIVERVCFVIANLHAPLECARIKMDIIFCQNVLIYFKRECRNKVLDGLVAHLKPGGLLVLGAGESVGWEHSDVARVRSRQLEAYIRH